MAGSEDKKLVGTLFLDLTQLKKDVAETNKLLESIGKNIKVDLTKVIKGQIESAFKSLGVDLNNIKKESHSVGKAIKGLASNLDTVTKASVKFSAGIKSAVTTTAQGFDKQGRIVKEIAKDGKIISSTIMSEDSISKANKIYAAQSKALKDLYAIKTKLASAKGDKEKGALSGEEARLSQVINSNKAIIGQMDQEIVKKSKLAGLANEEIALQNKLAVATAKASDSQEKLLISATRDALRRIELAKKQAALAEKNKDVGGASYWKQEEEASRGLVENLKQMATQMGDTSETGKKMLQMINDAEHAQVNMNNSVDVLSKKFDQALTRAIRMYGVMLAMRVITKVFKDATQYAQQYYDKMNEIRIVTMMSEEDANRLGQTYREMAKDMSVTSTEIATAATEFWRQGLSETEVNERLEFTTKYAKISALKFDEAAKIITAATNAMDVSAEHTADLFAFLGDESASGADEIGIAMQKASASAKEFGLSFEWLGAYIATMSEKTRQAPEVIGTSLNALLARLHSIRKKGFNEEDETKMSDVSIALNSIGVKLMDVNGQWRDMSNIFSDIASKWDGLTDKERAYISTTVAGVRQQNYFLTLMNDMAKGAEGGSRAYELYAGAIDAAGVASQKYAVWQESVTAAQNRYKASLEELYSLMNADMLKGFYNGLANITENFTKATKAVGGMNIVLPILAGAIALVAVKAKMAGGVLLAFGQALKLHPVAIAVTTIAALVFGISQLIGSLDEAKTEMDKITAASNKAKDSFDSFLAIKNDLADSSERIKELKDSYIELSSNASRTDEENEQLRLTISQIIDLCPSLAANIDVATGSFKGQTDVVSALNAELEKNEKLKRAKIKTELFSTTGEYESSRDTMKESIDLLTRKRNLVEEYVSWVNTSNRDVGKYRENPLDIHSDRAAIAFFQSRKKASDGSQFLKEMNSIYGRDTADTDKAFARVLQSDVNVIHEQVYIAEQELESLKTQYMNMVKLAFSDMTSELEPTAKHFADEQIDTLLEGFDISGDLDAELARMSDGVEKIISNYQDGLLQTPEGMSGSQFKEFNSYKKAIDNAWKNYQSALKIDNPEKVLEAAQKYNETVSQFESTFQRVDTSVLPEIKEEDLAKYREAAEVLEDVTAAANPENIQNWLTNAFGYDKTLEEDGSFESQIASLEELKNIMSSDEGFENFKTAWNNLTEGDRKKVLKSMGNDVKAFFKDLINGGGKAEDALVAINKEIQKLNLDNLEEEGKIIDGTADALEAAGKDAEEFNDQQGKILKTASEYYKAKKALSLIKDKGSKKTKEEIKELDAAYKVLSSFTGIDEGVLRNMNGFVSVEEQIAQSGAQVQETITQLLNVLEALSGGSFNPANYKTGMIDLGAQASATEKMIAGLINMLRQISGMSINISGGGLKRLGAFGSGSTKVTTSGGGGGGGGGGGSDKGMTEIEKMLDLMKQIDKIQEQRRTMNGLAKEYHEVRGEIQGVIVYLEREKKLVIESDDIEKENIRRIEEQIAIKKAEMATMDKSSEEYKIAAKELDSLQEAHMEYSEKVAQNKVDVEKLNEAIKEQKKIVRDLDIGIRETIHNAIKDREDLKKRILQGTVDMENTILAVIRKRYEKEKEEALKTANAKKEALEEEKNLLDEQLQKRRELAEEEDKEKKLAELEAKLARIEADPTRAKEAQKIRGQIKDLREEIGWDNAEKEVENKKDVIDEEIKNVDDYIEYVNNYYDDLFKHPAKLIEEMKKIIKGTDEEIIAWLQKNDEDYANASENTQQIMVNGWKDTLLDMHGETETYWDEVEEIIAQGDDAIIQFLVDNSADYKEAGKLQAQAYVDGWKEQIKDWHTAHKPIKEDIKDPNYDVIKPGEPSGHKGSGGSSSHKETNKETNKHKQPSFLDQIKDFANNAKKHKGSGGSNSDFSYIAYPGSNKFASGGVSTSTGLAWLDGTVAKPERVLSAKQTELFEALVEKIQRVPEIAVSSMRNYTASDLMSGNGNMEFGDINIYAESLDIDEDYEDVAEKMMNAIMEKANRGSAVGGIRLTK